MVQDPLFIHALWVPGLLVAQHQRRQPLAAHALSVSALQQVVLVQHRMHVQQGFTVMMLLRMQRKTCAPQATIALLVRALQRQTLVLLVRSLLAAQIT